MKIVIDEIKDFFVLPDKTQSVLADDIQLAKIWSALIKFFDEHNRVLMSTKFVLADETVEINNLESLEQNLQRDASEIIRIEMQTLPYEVALKVLFKQIDAIKVRIFEEIYNPIQKTLESSPNVETHIIKDNLFEKTPQKIELLSQMGSILFRFIFIKKYADVKNEYEILEELIRRIRTVIEHKDLSTLVHLFSYELIQLLEKLNKRLIQEISQFTY